MIAVLHGVTVFEHHSQQCRGTTPVCIDIHNLMHACIVVSCRVCKKLQCRDKLHKVMNICRRLPCLKEYLKRLSYSQNEDCCCILELKLSTKVKCRKACVCQCRGWQVGPVSQYHQTHGNVELTLGVALLLNFPPMKIYVKGEATAAAVRLRSASGWRKFQNTGHSVVAQMALYRCVCMPGRQWTAGNVSCLFPWDVTSVFQADVLCALGLLEKGVKGRNGASPVTGASPSLSNLIRN